MTSFTSIHVQVPCLSQGKTLAQTTELQSGINSFFMDYRSYLEEQLKSYKHSDMDNWQTWSQKLIK